MDAAQLAVVMGAAVSALVGMLIGNLKGRPWAGYFLGWLGPVGWIVAAFLPPSVEYDTRHQLAVAETLGDNDDEEDEGDLDQALTQLERLTDLHERGSLTDEEFENEKHRALAHSNR